MFMYLSQKVSCNTDLDLDDITKDLVVVFVFCFESHV